MKGWITASLVGLVALATLRPAAAQVKYNVTTAPLLTGAKEARATAINNLGHVAGETLASTSKIIKGWVWNPATPTSATNPRALDPLRGFPRSAALDINDQGYVVGKSHSSSSDGKATLWLPGQYTSPIDLDAQRSQGGFLRDYVLREAIAVSNVTADGLCYVVCLGDKPNPTPGSVTTKQGVICTVDKNGIMLSAVEPQTPSGDNSTIPWFELKDVNNSGQVSGVYWGGPTGYDYWSCIWDANSGFVFQATANMQNRAINDAGTVTGQNSDSMAYVLAFGASDAQILSAGFNYKGNPYQSISFGINNKNEVVGQSPEGGTYPAYLWLPTSGGQFNHYRLKDCVPYVRGMYLRKATGINESSSIICEGTLNNLSRAFLLTK